jgi:hypothetical protein
MGKALSNFNLAFRNGEDIAVKNVFVSALTVFSLGALVLSPAFAQSTPQSIPMRGMMGGDCPMMGMMHGRGMGQAMMRGGRMGKGMMGGHARMGAMAEGRLAYLKSELKVTNAQQDAWQEYSDAVKDRIGVMQSVRQTMMEAMKTGNANERMDARIIGMETMVAAMKAVKPATEKLYAALSNEQKKAADQLIGMGCGAM